MTVPVQSGRQLDPTRHLDDHPRVCVWHSSLMGETVPAALLLVTDMQLNRREEWARLSAMRSLGSTAVSRVLQEQPRAAGGESELIRAARSEPAALGELLNRHAAQLYRYLRARAPSDHDAEDLMQQVFVKAIDGLPRYRDRGIPFSAWLFRIAHNVLADARRRGRATLSWDLLPDSLTPVSDDLVEAHLLRQEARVRVRALLEDLTTAERELILLRFVAGLTFLEIAMAVGKSQSTVHREIKRILQLMKERYRDG